MRLAPAPTPELEALRQERLARFREQMRAWKRLDHFTVVIKHNGRRYLIEQLARDAHDAVYPTTYWLPAPPIVGRHHPGPQTSHPWDAVTPEAVQAYIDVDPFVREGHRPRMAAELAYIESFNPKARVA